MTALDVAAREVRQVLASPRTAPEWRWNAYRRLTAATAALAGKDLPVIPSQREGEDEGAGLHRRLDALTSDVLDRLDAPTIQRELEAVLLDLELLRQRGA